MKVPPSTGTILRWPYGVSATMCGFARMASNTSSGRLSIAMADPQSSSRIVALAMPPPSHID
ncbi:unannotated protein [freshwater metagenome]|uniref:Unannotated protein n=1 Tax=freshwater metagenome TaxID=449393 RepID=A0A6J7LCU3_9ZZZZ